MAVKFKDVKKKIESDVLTADEKNIIKNIEDWIDNIIIREFDNEPIEIHLPIADFTYNPFPEERSVLRRSRSKLMRKELDRRFNEAGWEVTIRIGPPSDLNDLDFWVLTGKV